MKIRQYLEKEKLDAIIIFNKSPAFKRLLKSDSSHGMLVLCKHKSIIFTSILEAPKVEGFKVIRWNRFMEDFRQMVRDEGLKRVGADYSFLFLKQKQFLSKHFRVEDCSEFLEELGMVKTEEEVQTIREACNITDRLFKQLMQDFCFKTESEIVKWMRIKMIENDVKESFDTIAASGPNATIPHHTSDGKLKRGFLVLDFGVRHKGYISDMTRTIFLGNPTVKEAAVYEKVLSINQECIEKAKVGMKASDLYDHSVKLFGEDAKYFTHSLGHGIGVEVHEQPNLGPSSKTRLAKGHVFTIEPGYYNPKTGIGIRIEDDVYLGNKKEILTRSPKDFISVSSWI